jgi:peptidoglycan/LPS O-acetylase OafA/YrhL
MRSSVALAREAPTDSLPRVVSTLTESVAPSATASRGADQARRWGYRPALDGLRAVAVYLVLAFHAGIADFEGGFIGVDLFFVLSGFVVTNVLLTELDGTGRIGLRRFYARRMRRLTPAALVCVVATAVMVTLVVPLAERLAYVGDARAALLYFANWHFLSASNDYFADSVDASPFLHFWSLSIEEQFYLGFPLVMIGLHRLARRARRPFLLPAGLAVLLVASLALQLLRADSDPSWAYYGTDTRLYQLLAGCLLAIVVRRVRVQHAPLAGATALGGLILLVLAAMPRFDVTPSTRGIVAAVLSVVVIGSLELHQRSWAGRALSLSTVTYLGTISYGTYLWHWPVILVLQRVLVVRPAVVFVLAGVTATALAALSARVMEEAVRRSRPLDRAPRIVIAAGLAFAVVTALVVVPPILRSERRPAIAASAAVDANVARIPDANAPVPDLDYEAILSERVPVPPCSIEEPDTCTVRRGSGDHVVLIGDSIALQWVPSFQRYAEELDWTLTFAVASACAWQAGLQPRPDINEQNLQACADRRDDWYEQVLPELDPDVIVLIELRRDEERWQALIRPTDPALSDASVVDVLRVTTERTLDQFLQLGAEIVLVQPTPLAPRPGPTQCLSGARVIGECAFLLVENPPHEQIFREAAAARPGVHLVDATEMICPSAPTCMPIVGGIPVYRDDGHLSAAFVRATEREFLELLLDSGAFGD